MIGKKGQIGETVTWVVATLIIILILGISIFLVSFLFKDSDRKFDYGSDRDFFVSKSLSGYLLTEGVYGDLVGLDEKRVGGIDDLGSRSFSDSNAYLVAVKFLRFASVSDVVINYGSGFYFDASDYEVVFLGDDRLVAADLGGENE